VDQEPGGSHPGVAGETRADCRVGYVDGHGIARICLIQRQVRLYLQSHAQQVPGNKGETATPTAAVVFALFAPVGVVHLRLDTTEIQQMYGLHAHHLLVCDALGLDHTWYEAPIVQKNTEGACIP
jgi:hypothetical protein